MLDIPCTPRPIPLAMTAPEIISDFDGYGSNNGNLSFGNAAWKYDTSQVFGNYGAGLMVLMVGKLAMMVDMVLNPHKPSSSSGDSLQKHEISRRIISELQGG